MQERKKNVKDELYSQTEIAELLGVSGSTISRAIDDLNLTPAKIDGKRRLYTAGQVDKIKKARQQATTSTGKDSTKDQLEKLRQDYLEQLKAKDKQIDQLNEQLRMAQINLNQAQQLQLEQAQEIKRLQLPEAPQDATGAAESTSNQSDKEKMVNRVRTAKVNTSDEPISDERKAEKASWWRRLFGRN